MSYSEAFQEAFERFKEKVDTSNIHNLRQMEMAFGTYAGKHWTGSSKQRAALAYAAEEEGMFVSAEDLRREREEAPHARVHIYGLPSSFTREGKQVTVSREQASGRFVSEKEGVEPKPLVVHRDARGRFTYAPEKAEAKVVKETIAEEISEEKAKEIAEEYAGEE
jgi:hypothetical protein